MVDLACGGVYRGRDLYNITDGVGHETKELSTSPHREGSVTVVVVYNEIIPSRYMVRTRDVFNNAQGVCRLSIHNRNCRVRGRIKCKEIRHSGCILPPVPLFVQRDLRVEGNTRLLRQWIQKRAENTTKLYINIYLYKAGGLSYFYVNWQKDRAEDEGHRTRG